MNQSKEGGITTGVSEVNQTHILIGSNVSMDGAKSTPSTYLEGSFEAALNFSYVKVSKPKAATVRFDAKASCATLAPFT